MASKSFLLPAIAVAGLAVAVSGCKGASDSPFAGVVKERHDNFEEIGDAFKAIGKEVKGGSPDLALVSAKAAIINADAAKIAALFPAGSGPESGVKTEALPAIWEKPAEFQAGIDKLSSTSAALKAAADSGDAAATGKAVAEVGGSCKGCHEKFREKD